MSLQLMKISPNLVQYFDINSSGVKTKVIKMKCTPNEKSETIIPYIEDTVEKLGIEKKVLEFTSDNTNCNVGGIGRASGYNVLGT